MIPPSVHSCFRILFLALSLLALGACVSAPIKKSAGPAVAVPSPHGPTADAGQEAHAQELLGQARRSSDPAVARKALEAALKVGDLDAALTAAKRWQHLAPESTQVRRYIAILELRTGNMKGAAESFDSWVNEPGAKPAQRIAVIGTLLAGEQDRSAALQVMRQIVASHPQIAEGQYALSLLALRLHDLALAQAAAGRALALRPGWTGATVLNARVMIAAGQADQGLASVAKLVKASPADWRLRRSFATLLVQAGKNDEARAQYERVLTAQAQDPDTLFALGLLALQAEKFDRAERYFTLLLETGERNQDAYYYLGETLLKQGDDASAINFFERVTRGDYAPDAQIGIARALVKLKGLEQAQDYLASVRERNPGFATGLYLGEADMLQGLGKPAAARKLLDQAVTEYPHDRDLRYNRALIAASMGDSLTALADLRVLAKVEPDNPDVLNALGYTLTQATDHYLEALSYIQRALALKPGAPEILDSLGWVQYRLGDHARALKNLRAAYQGSEEPEIAAHLVEVLWVSGAKTQASTFWNKVSGRFPDSSALQAVGRRFKLK